MSSTNEKIQIANDLDSILPKNSNLNYFKEIIDICTLMYNNNSFIKKYEKVKPYFELIRNVTMSLMNIDPDNIHIQKVFENFKPYIEFFIKCLNELEKNSIISKIKRILIIIM